ncbi:YecA family protein [Flavobacterium davisii]|uniref:YecA family protein n=1 Tax=Flavobacterium davisii TaxID=2906077 RepID=UPI0035CF064C
MTKIGRNDFCVCGSGLKYKKCCLNKTYDNFRNFKNENLFNNKLDKNDLTFFSQFNKKELLSVIALLKSLPQNHGKNIRLEEIQKKVLLTENHQDKTIDFEKLNKYLSKSYAFNYQEDPPENLFTENIMTPLGNMIVFPGVTEGQVYILQSLINVLSNKNSLPNAFIEEALGSTFFLLIVSDLICSSLNYERNLSYIDTDSNNIFFPNDDFLDKNMGKLIFSKERFEELSDKIHLDFSLIENFLIDVTKDDLKTNDPNENPLIFKPILKIDNDYIVISPTNLVFAIVFNIYKLGVKHNCLDALIKQFSKECWEQCNFILDDFGYKKIDFNLIQNNLPFHEGIYIFDTDKIAYVTYQFDDAKDYNSVYPLTPYFGNDIQNKILKHKKQTYNNLISNNDFERYEIFNLNITLGIGRPTMIMFEDLDEKCIHLGLRMDELLILHKSNKLNNLTLYNFAKAKTKINLITPFFLDNISMFIKNEESFYIDDNYRPDGLFVTIGSALDFKTEAIIKNDAHLGIYPNEDDFIFLPAEREFLPANLPIYRTKNIDKFSNKILSRAFEREIWFESSNDNNEINKNHFIIEICIGIAYWLNEISLRLNPYLKLNKIKPLVFKIDFEYIENILEEFDRLDNSIDPFEQINYSVNKNEINIELDSYFYKVIFRNDNFGEQLLIKRILYILSQIYDSNNNRILNLDLKEIDIFINDNIPVNQKKKILLQISDMDVRKNPKNLINYNRKLSLYHINNQLDNLSKSLGYSETKEDIILKGIEKEELLKKIINHFQNLIKNNISKFDFEDVITKLLGFYELIIFKREHSKFQLIPKIECFKDYCDIQKLISDDFKKNTQISLSVRCLIEYVINNPPNGDEYFNSDKFDETIALMNNIINWGFLYDQHIFNISEIEISILKSGRIGNSKEFRDKNIEPFYNEKFREDVFDYSNVFMKYHFELPKTDKNINDNIEKDEFMLAFEDEFEIDYYSFTDIVFESIILAFEEKKSVVSKRKKDFISTLSKKLKIEFIEVEKIINTFSIVVNVNNQINYFDDENKENYPWRFNRKLSLLQKPFIIRTNENEEIIYFGSRALYDSFMNLYDLIFSGRYNSKKSKMKSFLSKINKEKGDVFNNELYDLLKSTLNCIIIEKEVTIGPKKKDILKSIIDLGDFDILIVNLEIKTILCIESKNTNFARTPYEINREINNFITKNNRGWINKVEEREKWFKENKNSIRVFNDSIDYSSFKIEYVFITKEAIPLSYIKEMNYRFLTIYDVKNNPYKSLFKRPIKTSTAKN